MPFSVRIAHAAVQLIQVHTTASRLKHTTYYSIPSKATFHPLKVETLVCIAALNLLVRMSSSTNPIPKYESTFQSKFLMSHRIMLSSFF